MQLKYGPYSPSRLDTGTCPYAFHRLYVEPEEDARRWESLPQARGQVIHEVFEIITQSHIERGEGSCLKQDMKQWIIDGVNRHPAAYPQLNEMIKMAFMYNNRKPPILTADATMEERLAVKLMPDNSFEECHYDDPEAFARGRADILMISDDTTEAFIYDHKTQKHVEEADTFQMGFYAWVLSKIHPYLEKIHTVLYFAQFGYYSTQMTWTKHELDIIEDQMFTMVQTLENHTIWEPVAHNGCQYCPFIGECPAMSKFVEVSADGYRVKKANLEVIGDHEKAREIAASVHLLEQFLTTAKKNLKEFCKTYGVSVSIPGKTYDARASQKLDWTKADKDELIRTFKKHGVDPLRYMGFTSKDSDNVWVDGAPSLRKELAPLVPRTIKTDFRGRK